MFKFPKASQLGNMTSSKWHFTRKSALEGSALTFSYSLLNLFSSLTLCLYRQCSLNLDICKKQHKVNIDDAKSNKKPKLVYIFCPFQSSCPLGHLATSCSMSSLTYVFPYLKGPMISKTTSQCELKLPDS